MASTKDLRRRIKSVKNTSQITKAMQMVSATKMRRAQNQALLARPYQHLLFKTLSLVSGKVSPEAHPLFNSKSDKVGVLMFTTDKGLCGALNTNVFRAIQGSHLESGKAERNFYTIGKKGRDFLVRTGKNLIADYENPEHIHFNEAISIRKFLVKSFLTEEIGSLYLVYPHFISTLRQEARIIKVLPINQEEIDEAIKFYAETETEQEKHEGEFLFEPEMPSLLDYALNHLLDVQIYKGFLETRASEHSARMIAMQNATNNAKDLVTDLTLTYNQLRQESITRELLEITSAGAALE